MKKDFNSNITEKYTREFTKIIFDGRSRTMREARFASTLELDHSLKGTVAHCSVTPDKFLGFV